MLVNRVPYRRKFSPAGSSCFDPRPLPAPRSAGSESTECSRNQQRQYDDPERDGQELKPHRRRTQAGRPDRNARCLSPRETDNRQDDGGPAHDSDRDMRHSIVVKWFSRFGRRQLFALQFRDGGFSYRRGLFCDEFLHRRLG